MKILGKKLKSLWADESAQGATEYILLLVAIVALVLMFRGKLLGEDGQSGVIGSLVNRLSESIGNFK